MNEKSNTQEREKRLMNHYDERDTAEEESNAAHIRDEQANETAAERMSDEGFQFIGRHHLRSDTERSVSSLESMRAMVFGDLVMLTDDVVKFYRSDLYHDARWLRDYFADEMTFYFAVRESGTSIGTEREYVAYIGYAALYRVDIVKEERTYGESWYVSIGVEGEHLDTEQVRELVFNGFTREHAIAAVTESHGETQRYADALRASLAGQSLEGEVPDIYDYPGEER